VWFDSHCHLQICEEEASLPDLLARAKDEGVNDILSLGTDLESSRRCVEIAREHKDQVWAAVGVHPNSASGWSDAQIVEIEELAADERVVAIGESGLDFYRDSAGARDQEAALRAHIGLAKRTDRALVLHTRASARRTIEVLTDEGPPDALIFHCWSGDEDELEDALALGAFVGFAGNVTFNSADDLRSAAERVPSDRLLIETDAPYLAPVPKRGKPNEPAFAALTGNFLAELLGTPFDEFAQRTTANARTVFGLG
jgi:TatD DNase family protein